MNFMAVILFIKSSQQEQTIYSHEFIFVFILYFIGAFGKKINRGVDHIAGGGRECLQTEV